MVLKRRRIVRVPEIITEERIENKIFLIRGKKVIFDSDLAELYGVPTKRLKEQVRRNIKRFPDDFMIELTWKEGEMLSSRSQIATLKGKNLKYLPYAFTEQGVAMLSSVLNSDRAIEINIQIMRAFVKLREILFSYKELTKKLEHLERKFLEYDNNFIIVFKAIRKLLASQKLKSKTEKIPLGFYHRKDIGSN